MKLTAEQIMGNWTKFLQNIEDHISEPRKTQLLDFYVGLEERISLYPASNKKDYHNCFPGGYVDHVNRVVDCSIKINEVWKEMGVDDSTYTMEELVFSAINHDLGKIGSLEEQSYLPSTDAWRMKNLGEMYTFNKKVPFSGVPDRGLFLLQEAGIRYTFNEMIAIQTHDGLYDEANKKYLIGWGVESKPRTSLPFIVHQGDLMAARIEFEKEWLHTFDSSTPKKKANFNLKNKQTSAKNDALKTIKSPALEKMFKNL